MGLTLLLSVVFLSVTHADINGPSVATGIVGGVVEITCEFNKHFSSEQKYWCKGYYRRSCVILVQTQGLVRKSRDGRITITADNNKGELKIRMEGLTNADKGWYWCGIERYHLLDPLYPVELNVREAQALLPSDKERLRFFLIIGLVFGILTIMFIGLLFLVIRKIRKNKNNGASERVDGCKVEFKGMQEIEGEGTDKKEGDSTIENSVPKSNSMLAKEMEAGVTYATVAIQQSNNHQEDSTMYDNVNPPKVQEEKKPPVTEPPNAEPLEYSTIAFKK